MQSGTGQIETEGNRILRLDEFQEIRRIRKPDRETYRVKTLDDLHHVILSWSPLALEENPLDLLLSEVRDKSSFDSEVAYTKTFEPLILEEIRTCLVNALQDKERLGRTTKTVHDAKRFCRTPLKVETPQRHEAVFGKSIYDNTRGFDVLPLKFEGSSKTDGGQNHLQSNNRTRNDYNGAFFQAGDLILMQVCKNSSGPENSSPLIPVFAYVTNVLRKHDATYLSLRAKLSGKCTKPTSGHFVFASKLLNLQTHHRQYEALWKIHKLPIPLMNSILRPSSYLKPKGMESMREFRDDSQCFETLRNLNHAQTRAVFAATRPKQKSRTNSHCSITLLQGPPGTGKTKTIIAMLTRLLSKAGCGHRGLLNPNGTRANSHEHFRILICAPSNAAVDGIMKRVLQNGIEFRSGTFATPWSIRIGNGSNDPVISSMTPGACLRRQNKCSLNTDEAKIRLRRTTLLQEVRKVSSLIGTVDRDRNVTRQLKKDETNNASAGTIPTYERTLTRKLCALHDSKKALLAQLEDLNIKLKEFQLQRCKDRTEQLTSIVSRASLVFATLNSSGADVLKLCKYDFSAIIIDEAAQSVELETFIPIVNFPCSSLIFVGDPMQLPATVISNHPKMTSLYRRSLFERFVKQNFEPIFFLQRQYRMHPAISCLPSQLFYSGKLKNGALASADYQRPFHTDSLRRFGPLSFIDTTLFRGAREERTYCGSIRNRMEAMVVAVVIASLLRRYSSYAQSSDICVLTPYKAQIREIQIELSRFDDLGAGNIQVSTVDSIQGREKEIVVFSAVRGDRDSIGFVRDMRRMNVAITRSKVALIVVGNSRGLSKADANWAALVDRCYNLGSHLQLHESLKQHFPEAYNPHMRCATGPFNYSPLSHDDDCESSSSYESDSSADEENQNDHVTSVPDPRLDFAPDVHAKMVLERVKRVLLKETRNKARERKQIKWRQALYLEETKDVKSSFVASSVVKAANPRKEQKSSIPSSPSKRFRRTSLNPKKEELNPVSGPLPLKSVQRTLLKRKRETSDSKTLGPSSKIRRRSLPGFKQNLQVLRASSVAADKAKLIKLRALRSKQKKTPTLLPSQGIFVRQFPLSAAAKDIQATASRGLTR